MRFGSVCSGIEAASAAWNPLGWKAAWFSEIEAFPSAVLAHHHPDVPNYGDMTLLPERIRSGEVEAPDVFCGGTPCQAFSVAGKRQSLDDARGNLSLIFCEIANAIDDIRHDRGKQPSIVFWENVPGVLSTKDNAFGCFLAQLCGGDEPLHAPDGWPDAGCVSGERRTAAWRVLDAQYVGLAQRRRRVFVVASARNGFDPAAVLFEFDGVRRDTAPSREAGKVAPTIPARSTGGGGLGTDFDCDGGVITMAHGQGGAEIGFDRNGLQHTVGTLCADTHPGAYSGQDAYTGRLVPQLVAFPANLSGTQCASTENLSPALGAMNPTAVLQSIAFAQNTRDEVRLIGGNGSIVGALAAQPGMKQQCYVAQAAYGFQPRIARNGRGDMGEVVSALNAHSGETGKGDAAPCVAYPLDLRNAMQVRRLTPVECERLQGFPDNHTAIPWRKKPASECPDGPRYKSLGNSWAVPVVAWIGKRITNHLEEQA
jgi:DNA (cytosine-5)-methyltransferase 1